MESDDPAFSAWLRRHGRQAALRDGEVDALERAGSAACREVGAREAVMQSLYGRAAPAPTPPSYTPAEIAAVAARAAAEEGAGGVLSEGDRAWRDAAAPPPGCEATGGSVPASPPTPHHVWWQTPVSVTVVVRLPDGWGGRDVSVSFERDYVSLTADAHRGGPPALALAGPPRRPLAPAACTWTACDGVVTLALVKASRRGRYADGETAADTWWRSLWRAEDGSVAVAQPAALLPEAAPVEYYGLRDEEE